MDRKGKVTAAIAVACVAVMVAASAVRCVAVHGAEDGRAPAVVGQQERSESAGAEEPAGAEDPIAVLKQTAWEADGGKAEMSFKDGRFVESDAKGQELTLVDVESVETGADQATIEATVEDAEGKRAPTVIVLRRNAEGLREVASDSFRKARSYTEGASGEISVEGVNAELTELIGGDVTGLSAAISERKAQSAPGARKATWDQVLTVDYKAGEASAAFTLDDAASTVVTVTYSLKDRTFEAVG